MLKVRLNLRKVAMVFACLAVTIVFATCGKNGGDDNDGNIDPKLVGSWGYFGDKTVPKVYIFNQDGSFLHYSAVRLNDYMLTAYEYIYKGKYQVDGSTIKFENVSIARFDRKNDNENRNKIGDREHAKEMLKTTKGFETWNLEQKEYKFIETGVVRIFSSDDTDEIRSKFRADWETYNGW